MFIYSVSVIGYRIISLPVPDYPVFLFLVYGFKLVFVLFCTFRSGWGFDGYIEEANTGKGIRMPGKLKNYFRFVLPVLILIVFIQGLM